MAQPVIKTSFASGEWAPKLRGRVDIQKYHAGAALMRNFVVDYSGGGASTRQGTEFINRVMIPGARLIPFQPSTTLSFVLEFGDFYIRFISNSGYILEDQVPINTYSNANPGVIGSPAHGLSNGDWVFINTLAGGNFPQLNQQYFIVKNATLNTFALFFLNGTPVDTTLFGSYTVVSGVAARVYTIHSPYAMGDLFPNSLTGNPGLKYLQDVTSLIITHPNYPPAVLTEIAFNNWTLTPISFNPTIGPPAVTGATSSGSATWAYFYVVTSVDINGQESSTSPTVRIAAGDITNLTTPFTNTLTWSAVPNAISYNIYRSAPIFISGADPTGPDLGFIGNIIPASGAAGRFQESSPGFAPDFSVGPPISPNTGAGVKSISITTNPNITSVPGVIIAAPPAGGIQAAAVATATVIAVTPSAMQVSSSDPTQGGVAVSPVGASIPLGNGITITITAAALLSGTIYNISGIVFVGTANSSTLGPLQTVITLAVGGAWAFPGAPQYSILTRTGSQAIQAWNLKSIGVTNTGSGYTSAPAVTFSSGGTTATAIIGSQFGGVSINPLQFGNPGVPGFYQERLVLAGPPQAVQTYFMSQPGLFFNFNTSFPSQDNDALSGTIVGEDLNDIRSLIDSPTGIIALTGKGAWLINGGGGIGSTAAITPANQTANPQAFNGANDLRPIKINRDILYGTNKGNYFRDLSYNIYANIYTGDDITVLSNHLFFGFYSLDWAWSEEPFKTLWVVRNDGILLSLGYVKEQELVGWAHHDTDGQFLSVCSVIENNGGNIVDAIYFIVQRTINGQLVQYVERQANRYFTYGAEDAWNVDCGLQTQPAVTTLTTLTVTGDASVVGNVVTLSDSISTNFFSQMASANWIVRAGGGIYKIVTFISTSVVTAQVVKVSPFIDQYTNSSFPITTGYTIWQPNTVVTGLQSLIGKTVTGLADGVVIPPQVVAANGTITLATAATKMTVGLAYLPQLQTLPLDLGEPTVQSKRKKLPALTLRVADTLGLQAGTSFANALQFKDFLLGNLNIQSNTLVSDLYSGDGRMILDQYWQEPGQLCIQQNLPYPATVIAVIPEVAVGDSSK